MTNEQAKKMIKAKLECLKRETSGTDFDCNNSNCDECSLCYEQGNMGEQKEALDMAIKALEQLTSAQPTLRERALMLLLDWAVECGFGYDNFPEEYERYKDEIEDMSYIDGMIYIAEKEVERNG